LEDLFVNFSGSAMESLQTLADQAQGTKARALLEEIARRRAVEESE
jgi:hypothetical protein